MLPKLFVALVWNEVCVCVLCIVGTGAVTTLLFVHVAVKSLSQCTTIFFNDVIIITHVFKSITTAAAATQVFISHSCTHQFSKHCKHLLFKWHMNGSIVYIRWNPFLIYNKSNKAAAAVVATTTRVLLWDYSLKTFRRLQMYTTNSHPGNRFQVPSENNLWSCEYDSLGMDFFPQVEKHFGVDSFSCRERERRTI